MTSARPLGAGFERWITVVPGRCEPFEASGAWGDGSDNSASIIHTRQRWDVMREKYRHDVANV
jgi:hypothetical protein